MLPPSRRAREITLCAVALTVVAVLGVGVIYGARFVQLDLMTVRTLHAHAFSSVTSFFHDASALAGTTIALPLTAIVAFALLVRKHWHAALGVTLSVIATQAIVHGIKVIVERSRPPKTDAHVDAAGYSFPSAHAATSVALYGLIAIWAFTHLEGKARQYVCGTMLGVIGLVGATRVYLGAHYPTDVLAGWLVGSVIVLAIWRLVEEIRRRVDGAAVPAAA